MDAAMNNRTMSRRVATIIHAGDHQAPRSGFDFKADDVMDRSRRDAEERQAQQDDLMASMAQHAAAVPGARPGGRPNPPIGAPGGAREAGADVGDLDVLE
jgi:hypothetical protein